MSEISASDTPFPHWAGNIYKLQYSLNWQGKESEADKINMNKIRSLYGFTKPFVSDSPRGAFLKYRDLDIGTNDNGKNSYNEGKVYGKNFDRLVKVKTAVDPNNSLRTSRTSHQLR